MSSSEIISEVASTLGTFVQDAIPFFYLIAGLFLAIIALGIIFSGFKNLGKIFNGRRGKK